MLILSVDDMLKALKSLELENPDISPSVMKKAMELMLKELQFFPDDIRVKMLEIYPPPPPKVRKEGEPDEIDLLTGAFRKF